MTNGCAPVVWSLLNGGAAGITHRRSADAFNDGGLLASRFTPDAIADVLLKRRVAARILVNHRMHCVGCARREKLLAQKYWPQPTIIGKITRPCHTYGGTRSRSC